MRAGVLIVGSDRALAARQGRAMSKNWLRKTGLVGMFVVPVLVIVFARMTMADTTNPDSDPSTQSEPYDDSADAPPTRAWQPRNFFQPYDIGQGDQSAGDMTPEQKAELDAARAHYDTNAASIAQAWSRGTRARAEYAKLKIAEREAGLESTSDVGVE